MIAGLPTSLEDARRDKSSISSRARWPTGGWSRSACSAGLRSCFATEIIFTFTDKRVRGLNRSCLLAPGVLLLADCFAGLIWRVDLEARGQDANARVWLEHDTMANDPDNDSEIPPPPQPGINGVRYGAKDGYLYYTSTARKVFMRVPVDRHTLDPMGPPEFVAAIDNADDFCIDEQAGFAYVTTDGGTTAPPDGVVRPATLLRVHLTPRGT
jgi:hypothetical protein